MTYQLRLASMEYPAPSETTQGLSSESMDSHRIMSPDNNFIISYDHNHSPLSRYADNVWDFSCYQQSGTTSHSKMVFKKLPESVIPDVKWVMFAVLFLDDWASPNNLSVSTVLRYLMAVRRMGRYAHEQNISLFDIFSSEQHLIAASERMTSLTLIRAMGSVIDHLHILGPESCGVTVIRSEKFNVLKATKFAYFGTQQNAVIPSRIFSNLITELNKFETEINEHIFSICRLVEFMSDGKCANDAKSASPARNRYRGFNTTNFANVVKSLGLTELLHKYNIDGPNDLKLFVVGIQHYGKLMIHIYSGMRSQEVLSLKVGCLTQTSTRNGSEYELSGDTSKLSGGRKSVTWVTSENVVPAIKILEALATTINQYATLPDGQLPLFISTSYCGIVGNPRQAYGLPMKAAFEKDKGEIFCYLDEQAFAIRDEDVKQLNQVDPFRAWDAEERFKVESVWRFTSHQFRRSLAYYVAQSSLVSLPSLKRQLKHISRNMTIHYAQAIDLPSEFDADQHFIHLLSGKKPEADAAAFLANIVNSEEELHGAHGKILQKGLAPDYRGAVFKSPRNELVKKFNRGEISYSETAMGACTSTAPCDKKALRILSACVGCKSAVIKKSKLKNLITHQKSFVDELVPGTIEYKIELAELDALTKFQKQISKGIDDEQ